MSEENIGKRSTTELVIKCLLFTATVIPSILAGSIFSSMGIMRWPEFLLMFAGMFIAQLAGNYLFYYFANSKSNQKTYPGWKPFFADGWLTGKGLLFAGLVCLAIDAAIGLYFVINTGWQVALFAFAGGALIALLTPLSFTGLREISAFLGFGPLAMSGMTLVMSGKMFVPEVVAASIPVGLWVAIIAHFKSAKIKEIDTNKGTISLTTSRAIVVVMAVFSYIALISGVILRFLPAYCLLSLISIVPMFFSIRAMFSNSTASNYVKAVTMSIVALVIGGLMMSVTFLI